MQRKPPADTVHGRRAAYARWAFGMAAAAFVAATAAGQSPPKTAAVASANAAPPTVELAQNAGLQPSSAQLMREDEAELLDLAAQVRTEVDHNPHDDLLMDVVRKAERIRRLAERLKQEMKLTSRRK